MAVRRNAPAFIFCQSPAMTQAAPPDLSKLRIDRGAAPVVSRRRRRWLVVGRILLVLVAGRRVVRAAAAAGRRADDVGGHDLSVAAVRAAQRDRLRGGAAQGRDLVEGDRAARMAGRGRRLARQGRRHHRAHRRARRRRAGRKARRPT